MPPKTVWLYVITLAALIALRSHPTQATVTTGELLELCENYPGGAMSNTCELYISSVIEIVNLDEAEANPRGKLCVQENVQLSDLVPDIMQWMSKRGSSATIYDTLHGFFSARYAC